VRTADGPPQRIGIKVSSIFQVMRLGSSVSNACSGEKKYYLADLPAEMDLRNLAATIKARWIREQAHQQLKEELGLDHFEGRFWQGLHRRALMTVIAYAFLQHRRLKSEAAKQKTSATAILEQYPSRHSLATGPRFRRDLPDCYGDN
jgi:SRSO17 transposase